MEKILEIPQIEELVREGKIKWRGHASQRLLERNIERNSVIQALLSGEIIEDYQEDFPFPSCLILGHNGNNKPLHIVCAIGQEFLWIITVYEPDLKKWHGDFKTRKR
jgi:hypothetical protein